MKTILDKVRMTNRLLLIVGALICLSAAYYRGYAEGQRVADRWWKAHTTKLEWKCFGGE